MEYVTYFANVIEETCINWNSFIETSQLSLELCTLHTLSKNFDDEEEEEENEA